MKEVLVTGAAGFIGSAVAARFIENGARVTTIDNMSTGRPERVPRGVDLITGDCQDPLVIDQLRKKRFDAILHIAGQSSGEISYDDPVYDLQTNTQSTLMLLDHARREGISTFVYASTMSVYGDQGMDAVSESAEAKPISFYATGKLASEQYIRQYSAQFGISALALRLFNVYGPGQNLGNLRQGMISIYLAQALSSGHIVVKGAPDRFRDHIYIDDVVEAFVRATRCGGAGESVNVGTGVSTTVGTLISEIVGRVPATVEYSGSTPGDMQGIFADTTLLEEQLGYTPATTLKDGLEHFVAWAREENGLIGR